MFSFSLHATGQGLVDTPSNRLLQHIQQSKGDTSRVKFLLALSKQLILKSGAGKTQIDSAYALDRQAEQLSRKVNDLKNMGKSILMAALVENKKGDRDRGLQFAQQALSYFKRINDLTDEAEAIIIIGQHYEVSENNIAKIISYYQTAADLFRRAGEKERLATTLVDLGDYHHWNYNYIESLKNLREALKIYKDIGFSGLTNIYGLIGQDLLVEGDMENALKYSLLSEQSAMALKDTSLQLSTVYYRIGDCYRRLQYYKKAILYLEKGLMVANKYHSTSHIITHNLGLAMIHYMNHAPLQSNFYLDKIRGYNKSQVEGDAFMINNLYVRNYINLKKYNIAKSFLDKLTNYIERDKPKEIMVLEDRLYYLLATKQYKACYIYLALNKRIINSVKRPINAVNNELIWFKADSALGRYPDAIKHYQLSRKLSDSLFSLAKNKQVALLQIEYDTEQKEQQLSLQAKSIQLLKNNAQLEGQKQNARITALIGALATTVMVLGLGYSRYRLKQRTNLLLKSKQIKINQTNVLLQNLLTEKEWLLKEIHHRVKNNLQITMSLLSVQTRITTSQIAKEALLNGQRRLHSMSLIHQKLYQSEKLAFVEMSAYIGEMVTYLKGSFDNTNHITFKTEAEKLELDVAQAVPLGLILNEAITNAIKYAFPDKRRGEIIITLSSSEKDFHQLMITDNGNGLPDDAAKEENKSLGMELFKILTKQLDGELFIDGKNGTTVSVRFKVLDLFIKHNSI